MLFLAIKFWTFSFSMWDLTKQVIHFKLKWVKPKNNAEKLNLQDELNKIHVKYGATQSEKKKQKV